MFSQRFYVDPIYILSNWESLPAFGKNLGKNTVKQVLNSVEKTVKTPFNNFLNSDIIPSVSEVTKNAPCITNFKQISGTRLFRGGLSENTDKLMAKIFARHVSMQRIMEYGYLEKLLEHPLKHIGEIEANEWLVNFEESLKLGDTNLYCDDSDGKIKEKAYFLASSSNYQFMQCNDTFEAIELAKTICKKTEVELPLSLTIADEKLGNRERLVNKHLACLTRLSNEKWWRGQLRKSCIRKLDHVWRERGYVNRQKQLYVSDAAVYKRRDQNRRNRDLLESLEATNEDGYKAILLELSERSISNPKNRRNELMTRIRGTQEVAETMGLQCYFYTLTAPSKYHAFNTRIKKLNLKYNGATPKEAQNYLCEVWARVRAEWQRQEIDVFGLRVAEPHSDGCPHWHLMLFMTPETAKKANRIFRLHAVAEDRKELFVVAKKKYNFEPRFKVIELPASIAAGYVAKYISKNIDGLTTNDESIGDDFEALSSEEVGEQANAVLTSERVQAWSATWGIRQFQFIGSPSVTVYRELRRGCSNGAFENAKNMNKRVLSALVAAADLGDWAEFSKLMGGMCCKLKDQTLRALYVLKSEKNLYGEAIEELRGVVGDGLVKVITRIHQWKVTRVEAETSEQSICEGGQSPPLDLCQ